MCRNSGIVAIFDDLQNSSQVRKNIMKKLSNVECKEVIFSILKEFADFCDTIKAEKAGNVVLSAFPAFSVTNLLLVQCSSAVLQCSYGCIRAHPFPLIYAP